MRVYLLDSGGSGLEKILSWLSEEKSITEVAVMKSPDIFLERVEGERPEMVFIRLGANEIPGLTLGLMVKTIDPDIRIVFVSEERDYALDAYEIGAYGYLLCPVERRKFDKIFVSKNG